MRKWKFTGLRATRHAMTSDRYIPRCFGSRAIVVRWLKSREVKVLCPGFFKKKFDEMLGFKEAT